LKIEIRAVKGKLSGSIARGLMSRVWLQALIIEISKEQFVIFL